MAAEIAEETEYKEEPAPGWIAQELTTEETQELTTEETTPNKFDSDKRQYKGYTHSDIIYNFFYSKDRRHYCKGARVFFEDDRLYSFGHHFILAIRTKHNAFIINADKYSVSTSCHQSIAISISPKGTPQIPFSALGAANVQIDNIEIIDKSDDTWEMRTTRDPKTGKKKTYLVHHLGACLFREGGRYFLSAIDLECRRPQYFLVELVNPASSVYEAFRQISGLNNEDWEAYTRGEILRQGEYFFKPVGTTNELKQQLKIKKLEIKKRVDLNELFFREPTGGLSSLFTQRRNPHIATECINYNGAVYARGTVRHTEHKMLRLGKLWHKVALNFVFDSWTAAGAVD